MNKLLNEWVPITRFLSAIDNILTTGLGTYELFTAS